MTLSYLIPPMFNSFIHRQFKIISFFILNPHFLNEETYLNFLNR